MPELKHKAQRSCSSHQINGGSIYIDGDEGRKSKLGRENNGFPFGNVKFEIFVRHSNRDVNWARGRIILEPQRGV